MILLTNYCDVAGTVADHGYLIGAALISTEKKWLRFDREWHVALKKHNLPGIHMTDYMRLNPSSPYDGMTDEEREALETKLVNIAKRGIRYTMILGLQLSAFREVNKTYCLEEELGNPYYFLAMALVFRAGEWINNKHPGAQFRFFFERGDTGQGKFRHFVDKNDLHGIHFEPKIHPVTRQWLHPLEAADMVGWVVRRAANRVSVPRKLAHKVRDQIPQKAYRMGKERLIELCEKYPNLFPRRASVAS